MEINHEYEGIENNEILLTHLMDEFGSDLKRIAYSFVKDKSQCDDIVQEVFISCYRNLDKFRYESEYKTWLIRITLNKCKDYHRKWSFRNIKYQSSVLQNMASDHHKPSAEDELIKKENASELLDAISSLKPKYKEIIILYYVQDLKLKEISEVTRLNFHTSKTRFVRGKELLKKELERRGILNGFI
ncbi:sigma-70 family RNA polymerase sigma factor [Gracilibacillus caseinilyticus]|uniref:Sigma-70 family RNA polymerase sigma factor n=1 Tax=Gracilibacillus caseinilyticus TaxID=2932256 RepID=A0ABY4EQ75_9BACI|nr:sigma-70 family RNA polymerase sigma factor [Gracilibacillus caseinilyticus]UOQ46611.1 sigma-70 family RNA polymerase sigma factor [Gracilibacillus caseinilyticus]